MFWLINWPDLGDYLFITQPISGPRLNQLGEYNKNYLVLSVDLEWYIVGLKTIDLTQRFPGK
jgi:hypothetical protein